MEPHVRHVLLGYRPQAVKELFADLKAESAEAGKERREHLARLERRLETALEEVRETEKLVADVQAEQQALFTKLDQVASRGPEEVQRTRDELQQRKAALIADVMRREVVLGRWRALLRRLGAAVSDVAHAAASGIEPAEWERVESAITALRQSQGDARVEQRLEV